MLLIWLQKSLMMVPEPSNKDPGAWHMVPESPNTSSGTPKWHQNSYYSCRNPSYDTRSPSHGLRKPEYGSMNPSLDKEIPSIPPETLHIITLSPEYGSKSLI